MPHQRTSLRLKFSARVFSFFKTSGTTTVASGDEVLLNALYCTVCILSMSSERIRIIEAFCHSYTLSLKHLRMPKLRLFINTYYLQVSRYDMSLKLLLTIVFDN